MTLQYFGFCFLVWATSLYANCHPAISILEANISEDFAIEIKPIAVTSLARSFPQLHLDDIEDKLKDLIFEHYRFLEAIIQQIPTNRFSPYLFVEIPIWEKNFIINLQRVDLDSLPADVPSSYLYHRYKVLNVLVAPESGQDDPALKVAIKKDFNARIKDRWYASKGNLKSWPPLQFIPFSNLPDKQKVIISTQMQMMLSFVDEQDIKKGQIIKNRSVFQIFLPLPYIVKPGVLNQILRNYQIDLALFKRIMAEWDHSLVDDATELGRKRHYKNATVNLDGKEYRIIFHLGTTEKIPAVVTVIPN